MNKLKITNNKILSLLMLSCIATSNLSLNAGIFSNLFTPPTTSELIFKYAKKAGKWSKKQAKWALEYIPHTAVVGLSNAAASLIISKIITYCVKSPYKKINDAIEESKKNTEILETKNELKNKVMQTKNGQIIKLSKKQLDLILEYQESLNSKRNFHFTKEAIENTLKKIDILEEELKNPSKNIIESNSNEKSETENILTLIKFIKNNTTNKYNLKKIN